MQSSLHGLTVENSDAGVTRSQASVGRPAGLKRTMAGLPVEDLISTSAHGYWAVPIIAPAFKGTLAGGAGAYSCGVSRSGFGCDPSSQLPLVDMAARIRKASGALSLFILTCRIWP